MKCVCTCKYSHEEICTTSYQKITSLINIFFKWVFIIHPKKAKYLPKGPDLPPHLPHCFPIHLSPTGTGTRDLLQEQVCLLVRTRQREVWIPIFWTDALPAEGSACRLSSSCWNFNFKDASFFFFFFYLEVPEKKLKTLHFAFQMGALRELLASFGYYSLSQDKKIYI